MNPRFVALLLVAIACTGAPESSSQRAHVDSVAAAGGRVDSALSVAEHLRRFRESTPDPDTLRHASASADALVKRWVSALAASDTARLVAMAVDRAEFAWLFYPDARMSKPPYEMPAGLLWSQLLSSSDEGLRAALRQLGGKKLQLRAFRCPTPPDTQGASIVRQGCVVGFRVSGDSLPEDRYFGSILERAGRFKFLTFSNKL